MVHTTIGVYANWKKLGHNGYRINGVWDYHLTDHIEYNKTFRPGRALFVDGKCVHRGYLTFEDVKELEEKFKAEKFKQTRCTAPYQ